LGSVLQKPIGEGHDYAESWELVDHGADQSVVSDGPLQGSTLHELLVTHRQELLGRHSATFTGACFPLLFKFLDANQKLSVQVHPDDAAAAKLTPPDLGKTEAWIILHAEPGSCVYAGLKRGFDRPALAREVSRGTTELCLNKFEPRAGDCIFVPAGVVHALGQGLLVAEIQQASDTTYRLFDWNRVGTDGQPRTLHIEQALDAIDYDFGPVKATEQPHVERLVACDKFVLDRWRIDRPQALELNDRFHIAAVTQGEVTLAWEKETRILKTGQVTLLPASVANVEFQTTSPAELLVMYLP
jgi:mannose-6-phosphate isomerase